MLISCGYFSSNITFSVVRLRSSIVSETSSMWFGAHCKLPSMLKVRPSRRKPIGDRSTDEAWKCFTQSSTFPGLPGSRVSKTNSLGDVLVPLFVNHSGMHVFMRNSQVCRFLAPPSRLRKLGTWYRLGHDGIPVCCLVRVNYEVECLHHKDRNESGVAFGIMNRSRLVRLRHMLLLFTGTVPWTSPIAKGTMNWRSALVVSSWHVGLRFLDFLYPRDVSTGRIEIFNNSSFFFGVFV